MTPVENTENLFSESVVVPNGGSVAPTVQTEGRALVGVLMPTAWTAAKLGIEASLDGTRFVSAVDNTGSVLQAAVAADQFVALPLDQAVFAPFVRVKSVNASNVAVNQGAARTLVLIFKRYLGGN